MPAAWLVAALATLGSLYLSEIAGLIPCQLCWFQRIAMYPLVALLGVATLRGDVAGAKRYATVFAMVGAVLAAYHYQLERFPSQPTLTCAAEAPCSIPVVNVWGFASVPFMALAAFLLILTVLLLARQAAAPNGD
ncbi:MAG: disulfide bond formation protein B [Candidatus Dormibacteraeota bacterium]|nr:disulfide bond formation protein B [Candidatus Dormibacteraeota bacterium]